MNGQGRLIHNSVNPETLKCPLVSEKKKKLWYVLTTEN